MKRVLLAALIFVMCLLSVATAAVPPAAARGSQGRGTPRATRAAPTARPTRTQASQTRPTRTPSGATLSTDEAAAALTAYAEQVLGRSVKVIKAGGAAMQISQTGESADAQSYAADIAAKTYYGTIEKGVASLSYGVGTLSGDVTIDVQGSSLGVYAITLAAGDIDEQTALILALQTYPALADLTFTAYPDVAGWLWYATGTTTALDPATRKAITLAEAVLLYALPGKNGLTITATVGRGEFASAIPKP